MSLSDKMDTKAVNALEPDSVCAQVADFKPYVAGLSIDEIRDRYGLSSVIKLASNENPLGTSPMVQNTLRAKADMAFRYAQSGNPRLVKAIAEHYGLNASRIVVGNGSDEIIDLLIRVRCVSGVHNIVAFKPCFSIYQTQSRFADIEFRQVPLMDNFHFDWDAFLAAADENTAIAFVTTPDNPSGWCPSVAELEQAAKSLPSSCLFVIDEAYMDFCDDESKHSLFKRLNEFPNVAILRTFSKSFGLAGLRLGYGVFPPKLADYIQRVRLPFSVNILAEEAGLAALQDRVFHAETLRITNEGRERLTKELTAMGCDVLPSMANFIMFKPPVEGPWLCEELLKRGVIIRSLKSYGMPEYARVTIGDGNENSIFLKAFKAILAEQAQTKVMNKIITLDGPAGVGKSTIAKQVAHALGIPYMDTGAMFRTIAMHVGPTLPDVLTNSDGTCALDETTLAELKSRILGFDFSLRGAGKESILSCNGHDIGDEIRTEEVGVLAAKVATIPVVRECLKAVQQRLGAKQALLAEGRDMGTEIFPQAAHKFFLDAAPEIRAQRRFDQLADMGKTPDLALLTEQIKQRDDQDRNRAVAPLKPASDAIMVDTGPMTIQEVFQYIVEKIA